MIKKAIIVSIKGTKLTNKEKILLSKEQPWGLILFKRNINSLSQIQNLIIDIRKYAKDKKFPILIDEEGGKVSRLRDILNHNFDAYFFGNLFTLNKKVSVVLYKNYIKSLSSKLRKIGINVNTIPVVDILRKNTNFVIGNRSFSNNKEIVKKFGKTTIKECHINRIISVIKHMPGHGCSNSDSHFKTPKVRLNKKVLNKIDFYPFKSTSAKLAMTAHIIFTKIVSQNVSKI